jgi:hypothetical protein
MMRGHAAYEALGGAIALGEADEAERATYAAHAAACALCDQEPEETRTLVASAFAAAQHGETWRPFVRDEIVACIERRRAVAGRRITTALGGAVVATLALNVALALGTGSRPRSVALPVAAPTVATPAYPLRAATRSAPVSGLYGRSTASELAARVPGIGIDPTVLSRRAAPSRAESSTVVGLPVSFESGHTAQH